METEIFTQQILFVKASSVVHKDYDDITHDIKAAVSISNGRFSIDSSRCNCIRLCYLSVLNVFPVQDM